jgi:hypothetical protein
MEGQAMKPHPTADELFQILDDNGIDYVVSERHEGVMYLGFTLDDTFNPGTKDDWEIRLCGDIHKHSIAGESFGVKVVEQWAIFNKQTGKEWKDPLEQYYLGFESEIEARSYLNGFFDAWKGTE